MNNILNYRIAYLKALTLAWQSSEFEELLYKQSNLLDFFSNNPELFNNYKNPFKHLEVRVSKSHCMEWAPADVQDWIGPNDFIQIALPNPPKINNEIANGDILATALADYYSIFPDFLGPLKHPGFNIIDDIKTLLPSTNAAGSPAPNLIGEGSISSFGATLVKVIALAWNNKDFKEELLTSSSNDLMASGHIGDASPIIAKYLGYKNPWNFNLQFFESSDFNYSIKEYSLPENNLIMHTGSWDEATIPNNRIVLWFPNKPTVESQMPTALTAYNNNGPAYPFTCS